MNRPASYDAELVKLYPKLVAFYINKFHRAPDEDVIQETITIAMESFEDYDPNKSKLLTWVYRIMMNTELNRYNYYKLRHKYAEKREESSVEPGFDNDIEFIKNVFNRLLPRQKKVLIMKSEGMKNGKIAAILKNQKHKDRIVSPNCIKSYVCLARNTFKKDLIKAGYPL